MLDRWAVVGECGRVVADDLSREEALLIANCRETADAMEALEDRLYASDLPLEEAAGEELSRAFRAVLRSRTLAGGA